MDNSVNHFLKNNNQDKKLKLVSVAILLVSLTTICILISIDGNTSFDQNNEQPRIMYKLADRHAFPESTAPRFQFLTPQYPPTEQTDSEARNSTFAAVLASSLMILGLGMVLMQTLMQGSSGRDVSGSAKKYSRNVEYAIGVLFGLVALSLLMAPPGAAGSSNTLDLSASDSDLMFTISNNGSVSYSVGHSGIVERQNVNEIIGGSGIDTIVGPQNDTTWIIDGDNAGEVNGVRFSGIENLQGMRDNSDVFRFFNEGKLSGELDGGAGGFDTLELNEGEYETISYKAWNPNDGIITMDGETIIYRGLEPIFDNTITADKVIDLTNNDDPDAKLSNHAAGSMKVDGSTFESITFKNPTNSLTIRGLDGNDKVTIESVSLFFKGDLIVEAETIVFDSNAVIDTDGDVVLRAYAKAVHSGSTSPAAPVSLSSSVEVYGTIKSKGHVSIEAKSELDVDLDTLWGDLNVKGTSSSKAVVKEDSTISADSLSVTALTVMDISIIMSNATPGVGAVTVGTDESNPYVQSTIAGIDGGATIIVGTGSIPGAGDLSLRVNATDTTDVRIDMTTDGSVQPGPWNGVRGNVYLTRDTQSYIGNSKDPLTMRGPNSTRIGPVEVRSQNENDTTDGVYGSVSSKYIGAQKNRISKDDSLATMENVDLQALSLDVIAVNTSTYRADAKVAGNSVTGTTRACVKDSKIDATPSSPDKGLIISALDTTLTRAQSGNTVITLTGSSLNLDQVSTLNEIDKNVEAFIDNDMKTILVTDGILNISARNDSSLSSIINAMSIIDTSVDLLSFSLNFKGAIAANGMVGNTLAYISDAPITAGGTEGDVTVSARNTATIDATCEAGTKVTEGPNAQVGVCVALNMVGWSVPQLLSKTPDSITEMGQDLDAEENSCTTLAFILNSNVTVTKNVLVEATNETLMNATVSNAAENTTSGMFGAKGVGVSAILSKNMVSILTKAFIDHEQTRGSIDAGGDVSVWSEDSSMIHANCKIVSSNITTHKGGLPIITSYKSDLNFDHESSDGEVLLDFGDTVYLAKDHVAGGRAKRMYQYLGKDLTTPLDLRTVDYTNLYLWKEVPETNMYPKITLMKGASSFQTAGMIAQNFIKSVVESNIDNTTVEADNSISYKPLDSNTSFSVTRGGRVRDVDSTG